MNEEYYEKLYKRLAGLLGWTNLHVASSGIHRGMYGTPPNWKEIGLHEGQRCSMPNWFTWAGCGPLMVEHEIEPSSNDEYTFAKANFEWDGFERFEPNVKTVEKIAAHPDKDSAMICAIIRAVITKLEDVKK